MEKILAAFSLKSLRECLNILAVLARNGRSVDALKKYVEENNQKISGHSYKPAKCKKCGKPMRKLRIEEDGGFYILACKCGFSKLEKEA
jgi:predicted Zn-ribbon and HTH transcriptional regulator